jgi:hypothetical protein
MKLKNTIVEIKNRWERGWECGSSDRVLESIPPTTKDK